MKPYSVIVFHKPSIIDSSCSLVIGTKVAPIEEDEGIACALDVFVVDDILNNFMTFDNEENSSLQLKS